MEGGHSVVVVQRVDLLHAGVSVALLLVWSECWVVLSSLTGEEGNRRSARSTLRLVQ